MSCRSIAGAALLAELTVSTTHRSRTVAGRTVRFIGVLALAACAAPQSGRTADTSKAIRAATAAPRTSVRGEAFLEGEGSLPQGAVVRVELRDTSKPQGSSAVLGTQEFAASEGPRWAFDLLAPDSLVGPQASLVVSARINAGDRLLFATGEDTRVEVGQANGPVQLRLSAVTQSVGSAAGGGQQVPSAQQVFDCGGDVFRITFGAGAAQVTMPDSTTVTLPRLTAPAGEAQAAPRQFTNGRMTFIEVVDGAQKVRFARGKRAFVDCTEVR